MRQPGLARNSAALDALTLTLAHEGREFHLKEVLQGMSNSDAESRVFFGLPGLLTLSCKVTLD